MEKTNIERLQVVAEGFQNLNDKVVFVGGSAAGLYAVDPAAIDPRPTMDVDCVVELYSYKEYVEFNELLRQRHFCEDTTPNAPTCRWIYQGEIVDVMPTDEKILGFSNRWYRPGFQNREKLTLPSGKVIHILPLTYYIATKLDAIASRGGSDYRCSHDFEDMIYVLNYCTDFHERYEHESNNQLQDFIKTRFSELLHRPNIHEEIECALPMGEEDRVDIILSKLSL